MPDKQNIKAKRDFYLENIKRAEKQVHDESSQNWSVIEIEERLAQLQANFEKFELKCLQLKCDLPSEESKEIIEQNEETEALFIELKTKMRTKMQMASSKEAQASSLNAQPTQEVQSTQSVQQQSVKNTWGVFCGDRRQWHAFYDEFEKAIHSNQNMTESEKLSVLMDAIGGEIKKVTLSLYADSYTKAWQSLCQVYGSSYKLSQWCIRELLKIQPMKKASTAAICQLIKHADECEAMLKRAQIFEKFDEAMALLVIDKVDPEITRAWERHRTMLAQSWADQAEQSSKQKTSADYMPNWQSVKDFLQSELNVFHDASISSVLCDDTQGAQSLEMQRSCVTPQTSGLVHTDGDGEKKAFVTSVQSLRVAKSQAPRFLQCSLCDGIHPRYKCDAFKQMSLAGRQAHVSSESLCEKCLRENHRGDCQQEKCNRSCPSCMPATAYHNSLLCPKRERQEAEFKAKANVNWNDESWE